MCSSLTFAPTLWHIGLSTAKIYINSICLLTQQAHEIILDSKVVIITLNFSLYNMLGKKILIIWNTCLLSALKVTGISRCVGQLSIIVINTLKINRLKNHCFGGFSPSLADSIALWWGSTSQQSMWYSKTTHLKAKKQKRKKKGVKIPQSPLRVSPQ
jgi:hypothetical protein